MPETEVVFHAVFTSSETFNASFTSDATFSAGFGEVVKVADVPVYEGEYSVTPRLYEQTLATDGYLMRDDVTVEVIPVTQTSNLFGGQTVVIG